MSDAIEPGIGCAPDPRLTWFDQCAILSCPALKPVLMSQAQQLFPEPKK